MSHHLNGELLSRILDECRLGGALERLLLGNNKLRGALDEMRRDRVWRITDDERLVGETIDLLSSHPVIASCIHAVHLEDCGGEVEGLLVGLFTALPWTALQHLSIDRQNAHGANRYYRQHQQSLVIDDLVTEILGSCGGQLRSLRIRHHLGLTNAAMDAVGRYCKQLEYLDLSGTMISASGLEFLKTKESETFKASETVRTTLRTLRLARCYLVEMPECLQIIGSCTNLERLDLSGIESFGGAFAHQLLPLLPRLRHLAIRDCPDFTLKSIDQLNSRHNGLRITHTARLKDDTSEAVREYLYSLLLLQQQ